MTEGVYRLNNFKAVSLFTTIFVAPTENTLYKYLHTKLYYLLVGILLCLCGHVRAQNTLQGTITDAQQGRVLQGVSIVIPDIHARAVTDSMGRFTISRIPAGTYIVNISMIGYKAYNQTIAIKGTTILNYTLAPSTAELQQVIVTGVSSATDIKNNPIPISVVTQTQLQQTTATNIIDAIAQTPGVSQLTTGPSVSKPIIRGLGFNRVVVINDGMRQEGEQWNEEVGIDIDEYTVDKVEILKGPASLCYGSDAMAGVINFLSAEPLPEGKIEGSFMQNYQTNNGLIASSANFAGNKKGFIWDIRYTGKMSHDYKNKYDGYVFNSAYGENNFKATLGVNKKWGYSHLHFSAYTIKLGEIEGDRDSATGKFMQHVPTTSGNDSEAIAPSNVFKAYNYYPVLHKQIMQYNALWDNNIKMGKGRMIVRLGLQQNHFEEADYANHPDFYNNNYSINTLNYDVQYIVPQIGKGIEWSAGINGMAQAATNSGTTFIVPDYHSFNGGLFGIVKKSIKRLTVSGGLRIDTRVLHAYDLYTDSNSVAVQSTNTQNLVHRFTAYNSNFSSASGSIGATYDITKVLYVKANLSRGFRAPNIAETGSNGIQDDGQVYYKIGNPLLKPEYSLQADITVGVNHADYTAEVNAFVNNINNYIYLTKLQSVHGGDSIRTDAVAHLSGPTFQYLSGNAVLSGGEVLFNIHPHSVKWLRFENGFSMVNAIQKHQGDSTKYLPTTPPVHIQSKLKFVFQKIVPYLNNTYFSLGVDDYFKQDKVYLKYGDETPTPGYTLMNVGIGSDVLAHKHTVCRIYISANNIANIAYQSNMSRLKYLDVNNVTGHTGVYNMGRNFSIKLLIPIGF